MNRACGDVDPSTGTFTATHYEMKIAEYGDIRFFGAGTEARRAVS
jgi:hypothetical protein